MAVALPVGELRCTGPFAQRITPRPWAIRVLASGTGKHAAIMPMAHRARQGRATFELASGKRSARYA